MIQFGILWLALPTKVWHVSFFLFLIEEESLFKMFRIEPYKNALVKVNVYNNCSCSPVVWTCNTSGKWKGWWDVLYLSICNVMLLLQIYLVVISFFPTSFDVSCRVGAKMKKEFDRQMPKWYQPPTQGEGFVLYIL